MPLGWHCTAYKANVKHCKGLAPVGTLRVKVHTFGYCAQGLEGQVEMNYAALKYVQTEVIRVEESIDVIQSQLCPAQLLIPTPEAPEVERTWKAT